MKTVTAAVAALLMLGLILVGANFRTSAFVSPSPAPQNGWPTPSASATSPAASGQYANVAPATFAAGAGSDSRPVIVNCQPGQQAIVRDAVVNGQSVSQIDCAAAAYAGAPAYATTAVDAYGRPVSDIQVVQPVYRTVPATTIVQPAPAPRASYPRVVRRSGRSWQKTALVIGGTTAAGAGIGGLIGGKKGALIGAAIGGGASTIYEAQKRR